jgi:hypothetical protein
VRKLEQLRRTRMAPPDRFVPINGASGSLSILGSPRPCCRSL